MTVAKNEKVNLLAQQEEKNLQDRLSKNFIFGGFYLNEDYKAAKAEVDHEQAQWTPKGHYAVNLAYLAADPYLNHHSCDVHQLYPNDLSVEEWTQLKLAFMQQPGTAGLVDELERILRRPDHQSSGSAEMNHMRQTAQKRVKRLYDHAQLQSSKGEGGQIVPTLHGDLAIEFNQNRGRCIDGFGDALHGIEEQYFQEGRAKDAGDLISRILTDYRMNSIKRYGALSPHNPKFRTTGPQLLKQRMLYALSLRSAESSIAYPSPGGPRSPALQPQAVKHRFLKGGGAQLEYHSPVVQFDPYDGEEIIEALQESRIRGL